MATASREQLKIYIVIGLSVVFIALGYFRFFPGKNAAPGVKAGVAVTPARIEVPAPVLPGMTPAPRAPESVPDPPRTALRNIFAPGQELSREPSAFRPEPPKPLPSLTLTGTITGGRSTLAFINGRTLRLGEKIEGFRVISITRNQVSLEGGGRMVILNVLEVRESGMP